MRIIIAAIVGGIVVFVWASVAHMLLPFGEMGLSTLPDETRFMESVKAVPSSGMYFFPGMSRAEDQKAWEERIKSSPSGLLVVTKSGGGMTPQRLVSEFVSNVIAALIAAILLSFMVGSWFKRAFAVALFGVFGIVSILVSYWIWYGFPIEFICGEAATEIIGWFLAGLVMAKLVRPPFPAIVPA
jgi:hypothetical protein